MVGTEKDKQDQRDVALVVTKGGPGDGVKPGDMAEYRARVSLLEIGEPTLRLSVGAAGVPSVREDKRFGGSSSQDRRGRAFDGRVPSRAAPWAFFRTAVPRVIEGPKTRRLQTKAYLGRIKSTLLCASIAALLSACAGNMQGVVRGIGQPVLFSYEQGMSSDMLMAEIDGEAFEGKAVMQGASTTVGTGFGTAVAGTSTVFGSSTIIGSSYTGAFVAVLIGNQGSTLSCQLQYADTSGFTTAGGVGVCHHSDGRIIDIVW